MRRRVSITHDANVKTGSRDPMSKVLGYCPATRCTYLPYTMPENWSTCCHTEFITEHPESRCNFLRSRSTGRMKKLAFQHQRYWGLLGAMMKVSKKHEGAQEKVTGGSGCVKQTIFCKLIHFCHALHHVLPHCSPLNFPRKPFLAVMATKCFVILRLAISRHSGAMASSVIGMGQVEHQP